MTTTPHLKVYPNPWHTFDHEGQPCGTVPFDPVHAGTGRRWVGARVASADLENKPKALMQRRTRDGARTYTLYSEEPVHRIRWVFEMAEPSLLPPIPYYLSALRTGDLIAADEATAARAGVPFLPREEALAAALARGCAAYQAERGCAPSMADWPACLCPPAPAAAPAPAPRLNVPTP